MSRGTSFSEWARQQEAGETPAQAELRRRLGAAFREQAERSAEEIAAGIGKARQAVADGDDAVIAYLLDVPVEDIRRVEGEES